MAVKWREADHPRAPDGEFTSKAGWAGQIVSAIAGRRGEHQRVAGRDIRTKLDYADLSQDMPGVVTSSGRPDNALGKIVAMQGFDGRPEVVSQAEMDHRVANGWTELWRGVSGHYVDPPDLYNGDVKHVTARENAESFRTGDYYPGVGIFGNGTYTTTRHEEAFGYGADEGMIRMALRPDARVVDWDELQKIAHKYFGGVYPEAIRERGTNRVLAATGAGMSLEEAKRLREPYRQLSDRLGERSAVLRDAGRLAAAMGFDAIAVQPRNENFRDGRIMYHVVLNRTAVAVQEAS